ncbi:MAG: response regulator, partial [Alphaproteobacteria bacterium]|nr:response regulator [Alphaproteobacteria bacterium]
MEKKILIIDDEELIRNLLGWGLAVAHGKTPLSPHSLRFAAAFDLVSALDLWREGQFDFVICDHRFPVCDAKERQQRGLPAAAGLYQPLFPEPPHVCNKESGSRFIWQASMDSWNRGQECAPILLLSGTLLSWKDDMREWCGINPDDRELFDPVIACWKPIRTEDVADIIRFTFAALDAPEPARRERALGPAPFNISN